MRHLVNQIVDWKSYQESKMILGHLTITILKYRGLYKEYLKKVEENKKLNEVFRVMLIKVCHQNNYQICMQWNCLVLYKQQWKIIQLYLKKIIHNRLWDWQFINHFQVI